MVQARRRWHLRLVSTGVVLGLAILCPACLVTYAPEFSAPAAVHAEGSCMCSICWNQHFCYDPHRPEGSQVYPLPCDKPDDEARSATRVVDAVLDREGGFFCWRPFFNAQVDTPNKECPVDEGARARVENLDPCLDVPACARPVAQCGAQPPGPACPEIASTPRPSVCVDVPGWTGHDIAADSIDGAVAAVSALVDRCARYDKLPPSGAAPARYCYLACVNPATCVLEPPAERSCIGCDGAWVMKQ